MRDWPALHLVVPPGGSFRVTRRIQLGARVLTIGRSDACEVRVDVPGVDEEHAKISAVAFVAVGPDCAMGDVPLDAGQRRLVTVGDEIQVGSVVLAVEEVLAVEGEADRDPSRRVPRIRVVEGQNFGADLSLDEENREYVIGRSTRADLVLDDREVSREHVKVVRRGGAVFIYDAASTRGSWLGRSAVYRGTRVEWQRPRMLKLGATVLALEVPGDVHDRAPAAQVSAPMTPPPKFRSRPPSLQASPAPHPSRAAFDAAPGPVADVVIDHDAPLRAASAPASMPLGSAPSLAAVTSTQVGRRTAWKRSAPRIGRVAGLFLFALALAAILGVLLFVFSLME